MKIIEKIDSYLNEQEKIIEFNPKDVPDAKLIKVGETFTKKGIQYEVTKWTKDKIFAKIYKK